MNRSEDSIAPLTGTIRAAIIGCGRISVIHLDTLRGIEGVEVVAVCDANEPAAERVAAGLPGAAAYSDVARMMREARPHVVHILTPPESHRDLIETVASHGAHAYVEKPLASTAPEARAIAEAAHRANVRVCPGHNRLFDPVFRKAERRIRAGEIGTIVSVRVEQGVSHSAKAASSATIPWSYAYEWGLYDNLMPHALYLASEFLDEHDEPRVTAFNVGGVREAAVEEIRVVIPARAASAEVSFTLNTAPEVNRMEISGTLGRVTVDFLRMNVTFDGKSWLPGAISRITSPIGIGLQMIGATFGAAAGVATGRIKRYPGIRVLVREFYRTLRAETPPPVGVEDGVLNVRQMEYVREACAPAEKPRPVLAALGDHPPAQVLVTGGSGFVGRRLLARLSATGVPTLATTRLRSRTEMLSSITWARADLRSDEDLRRALAGIDTVYHCAALVGVPGSTKDYEQVNVEGTLRLARLAAEAGVRTMVYLSSVSVYGIPSVGVDVDELSPYDARAAERGDYTRTKLEAEKALLEYARAHPSPRIVCLRPGAIYGPGADLPIGKMRFPSPAKRPALVGRRKIRMPISHVENVVGAMLAAAASDVPTGRVYNVVDDEDLSQGRIARILRELTNGRVRPIFLPYALAWALMLALDTVGAVRGRGMGTARYRLARTMADMRFRSDAARRDLGWRPAIDAREGLSSVLAAAHRVRGRAGPGADSGPQSPATAETAPPPPVDAGRT